jgi:hypothetical protein
VGCSGYTVRVFIIVDWISLMIMEQDLTTIRSKHL